MDSTRTSRYTSNCPFASQQWCVSYSLRRYGQRRHLRDKKLHGRRCVDRPNEVVRTVALDTSNVVCLLPKEIMRYNELQLKGRLLVATMSPSSRALAMTMICPGSSSFHQPTMGRATSRLLCGLPSTSVLPEHSHRKSNQKQAISLDHHEPIAHHVRVASETHKLSGPGRDPPCCGQLLQSRPPGKLHRI